MPPLLEAAFKLACATFYDISAAPNPAISRSRSVLNTLRIKTIRHLSGPKMAYRLRALAREVGPIELLGPLRLGRETPFLLSKLIFYNKLSKRRYYPERDRTLFESFGRQLSQKLEKNPAAVVLSPGSPGSQPIAYVECRQPIVIWTDATFAEAMKTHPAFSPERLCEETVRDGLANERAALERCSLAIYTSEWAAQSAIRHYNLDPRKVRVVPPGANLESGLPADQVEAVVARRPSTSCNLLFIATQWRAKGGDLAIEVARALNAANLPTKLTIIGAQPDRPEPLPPFVEALGNLRKSVPAELALMERSLRNAHFLILPTQAEGAPNVVCEAAAYGLPSLATDVCGVASVVSDRNGALFPLNAHADEYCSFIQNQFREYGRYKELARSSFNEYATRLNWGSAAAALLAEMMQLL
jgi:glycosyltransferase involved in cell wall biosynthesis